MNGLGKFAALCASIIALNACGGAQIAPAASSPSSFVRSRVTAQVPSPVHVYFIGDGSSDAWWSQDLRLGADGRLYYALEGGVPNAGEIGWFDPRSHAQSFEQTNNYEPAFIQETSGGSVWVSEYDNVSGQPTIDRYSGVGGKLTPIPIPVGPFQGGSFNGLDADLAASPDGSIWFGSYQSNQIGTIDPTTNQVTIYNVSAPGEPWGPVPRYMTMGSDGDLWVSDFFNDGVYRVDISGPSKGSTTFTQLPQGPWNQSDAEYALSLEEGSDGKLYVAGQGQNGGFVDSAPVGPTPTFTPLPMPAMNVQPSFVANGHGKIYFNDAHYYSLGIYDVASKHTVFLPLEGPLSATVVSGGRVAVDETGTPWIPCVAANSACVESIALTSVWQVFPATTIVLPSKDLNGNPLPPGMIGIGETGNSGPFTVSTKGDCVAAVMRGFDHDIQVNPLAVGQCTLKIADAHKRSVSVSIDIINEGGQPPSLAHPRPFHQTPSARPQPVQPSVR